MNNRQQKLALVGLGLSLFVAALDATIVSAAMPGIASSLGMTSRYTWPITAYLTTCAITTLLCGALAARFGIRRVVLCGIATFTIASACCALSGSIPQLTICRALQGAAGGVLESGAFIVMALLFEPRKRARHMGVFSSMYGIASIAGPLAGGILLESIGWQAIFMVNTPAGIAAFALTMRGLSRSSTQSAHTLDTPGILCAAAVITSLTLMFATSEDTAFASHAPAVTLTFTIVALVSGILLVRVERHRENAVVPMALFAHPQVKSAFAIGFCAQFSLLIGVVFIPRFCHEALGATSGDAALATIPITLALTLCSAASGRTIGKTGKMRIVSRMGFGAMGVGSLLMCFFGLHGMFSLAAASIVLGLGIGANMPVSNIAAQTGAEPRNVGKATSLAMTFRGLGATMGSAACGAAISASDTIAAAGFVAFALCIAIAIVGFAATWALPVLIERK